MRMSGKFVSVACLAIVCCWIGAQQPAGADDEKKKDGNQQRVTVQIKELKIGDMRVDEDVTKDGNTKRRVMAIRVHVLDGLDEKIEAILKEAGLKGDKLEKACERIVEACKKARGARPAVGTARRLMALPKAKIPQVIMVGPDGKQQKIELKVMEGSAPQGLPQRILDHIEKELKKAGVDDKQLDAVRKALEQAEKAHTGVFPGGFQWHGPHAMRVRAAQVGAAGDYMIGLSCMPVDDTLRKKLKLGEGVGLVIQSVFEDTPAKKAGIQEADVLVKVGNKDVAGIEDLVAAVQAAGKEKKKLALMILRDGKKRTVQVVPGDSKSIEISVTAEIDDQALDGLKKHLHIEGNILKHGPAGFGQMGPGVITKWGMFKVDATEVQDLKKQVENLSRQVEELKKAITKLKSDKD